VLCRGCFGRRGGDDVVQLVVPRELRGRVVSLAHGTLLAGRGGPAGTLGGVQRGFCWPGVHDCVTRCVASCDLCQRSVSVGTVSEAPLGKLLLVETPFSVVCVDVVGPIGPPSGGFRCILTTVDVCAGFTGAVPLGDVSASAVAEALLDVFSGVGLPRRVRSDR